LKPDHSFDWVFLFLIENILGEKFMLSEVRAEVSPSGPTKLKPDHLFDWVFCFGKKYSGRALLFSLFNKGKKEGRAFGSRFP